MPKLSAPFLRPYRKVLVIGMENTGRYNWMLYEALAETKHRVYVISPLHLKKSMGLARGKNDKVDAIRIALSLKKIMVSLSLGSALRPVSKSLKYCLPSAASAARINASYSNNNTIMPR
jgi:transposase